MRGPHLRALSSPPTLFLEPGEDQDPPRLGPDEERHAKVLRLRAGDACDGLDGAGRRWPLRVAEEGPEGLRLERVGPPLLEPAPGEEGASLPWIEIAVAWPRKQRAEAMIGPLVQLGTAAITPLAAEQRGPEPIPEAAPARWARLAQTALKQSGRTWLPAFGSPLTPERLVEARPGAALALFDPRAPMAFDTWLRSLPVGPASLGTRARPLVCVLGPEGGLTAAERETLLLAGASPVWLGPHVLRIETAAQAAMAIAGNVLGVCRHPRIDPLPE